MSVRKFEVLGAGCESCAVRVRAALDGLATVETVEIDEARDVAVVSVADGAGVTQDEVDRVLADASTGSGHAYRVLPGSWSTAARER